MATTIDTQTRKVGDTLRLSGTLTGDTIPSADASWTGAVAVITIVHDADATAYRTLQSCTLTATTAPRRFLYEGTAPLVADVGLYRYEVQVTFSDGTVTTFPNSDDKYKLKIVAALG